MNILVFPSGPFETNAYLIYCPATKKAAVIDPAPGSFQFLKQSIQENNLILDKILLTHSHWDHIADVATLKREFNAPVYINRLDEPNLKSPGADMLPCWIKIEGVVPDHYLQENDEVTVGNLLLKVIFTPGHTPGGICFYVPAEKILFAGDTLFKGTIGNLSFPTSQPNEMWNSLRKLAKLPSETKVYPGHGPTTTIGAESWLDKAEQIFGNS